MSEVCVFQHFSITTKEGGAVCPTVPLSMHDWLRKQRKPGSGPGQMLDILDGLFLLPSGVVCIHIRVVNLGGSCSFLQVTLQLVFLRSLLHSVLFPCQDICGPPHVGLQHSNL